MKGKKLARMLSPEEPLPSSSSSNAISHKNILDNFRSNPSSKAGGVQKHIDLADPEKQRTNKTATNTHSRCACCAHEHKFQWNPTIEFPLSNPKSKSRGTPKLTSCKSVDFLPKLKTNKTYDDEKPQTADPIESPHPEKSTRMIKRVRLIEQENELKKIMKKVALLKNQYQDLIVAGKNKSQKQEINKSDLLSKEKETEVIKYVPKQSVKTIQKLILVEKPVQKIVYNIKKVPKEVITYKDIVVEVPVVKQELIFIDLDPPEPVIQYVPKINIIQKKVLKNNPLNDKLRLEIELQEKKNMEMQKLLKDSRNEIQNLKKFIENEKDYQKQLTKIRSAQDLHIQNTKKTQNPELPKTDTSLSFSLRSVQKPRVISIDTEASSKPLPSVSSPNTSISENQPRILSQEISSRSPKFMRITSHGKIVDGFASNPTVIRIGTETKPSESVMMSPSSVKTIKAVRNYCRKNCGDVCTCITDIVITTTPKN